MNASMDDPYTPGQCTDCHDKNDSKKIPHGNTSGKDLLYQPSPQLCYSGKGNQTCHNNAAIPTMNQKEEFNKTSHHQLEDGKLACKACHDNHGSKHRFDLLKYYTDSNTSPYNSANFALCFVCHLEEKIVAKMSGETGHLANYMNQTNFRDEYNSWDSGFTAGFQNIHSPQTESLFIHTEYNCYACHNPHGAVNPAMTRSNLDYTYITNITPPGDWANQTALDQGNWNNSTMNLGGGLWSGCGFGCHQKGYGNY